MFVIPVECLQNNLMLLPVIARSEATKQSYPNSAYLEIASPPAKGGGLAMTHCRAIFQKIVYQSLVLRQLAKYPPKAGERWEHCIIKVLELRMSQF